jgi:hypothetical protein
VIPKIKIYDLNNELYFLEETSKKVIDICYVSPQSYSPYLSKGYSIIQKTDHIELYKLKFYINKNIHSSYNYEIFNIIKDELNKEYIKLVTELGKKSRENDLDFGKYYDINDRNISGNEIIYKLNRIPRSNQNTYWIISNNTTYQHILNKLQNIEFVFDINGRLVINNMYYIVNNLVEDGCLITGKKSQSNETGVICYILTDMDGNIIFEEHNSYDNKELTMYYSFIKTGHIPESNIFTIYARDIRYYRKKKLQKIQKIRELHNNL